MINSTVRQTLEFSGLDPVISVQEWMKGRGNGPKGAGFRRDDRHYIKKEGAGLVLSRQPASGNRFVSFQSPMVPFITKREAPLCNMQPVTSNQLFPNPLHQLTGISNNFQSRPGCLAGKNQISGWISQFNFYNGIDAFLDITLHQAMHGSL